MNDAFKDVSILWSDLVDFGYFTDDELSLITAINGYNIDTLNDCIYVRYGFHDFKQLRGDDDNE